MMTKDASTAADDAAAKGGKSNSDFSSPLLKPIRQIVIFVLGTSVLIVGIAMIVLPGPAMIVIPAGLAILATEFVWAKRWLKYLKRRAQDVAEWTANAVTPAKDATQGQPRRDEPLMKR